MNKIRLVMAVLLVAGGAVCASPASTWHGVGVHAQAGMETVSGRWTGIAGTGQSFGPAAGIGIGYELEHRRFLFSVGLEADYSALYAQRKEQEVLYHMDDGSVSPLRPYDNLYTLYRTAEQRMRMQKLTVRIPLTAGGQFGAFHFRTGVATALPVYHAATSSTTRSEAIAYEAFYDDFNDHPLVPAGRQHFSSPLSVEMPAVDIIPMIEAGWRFRASRRQTVRISLYAEYGIRTGTVRAGLKIQYLYRVQRKKYPCRCLLY